MNKQLLFLVLLLVSCQKTPVTRNPYLPNSRFQISVNTNLPQFIGLSTPPRVVFISQEGAGLRGIFLVAVGSNNYKAWEAANPNEPLSQCGFPLRVEGLTAVSRCEFSQGDVYSLITGEALESHQNTNLYPLLEYRVSVSGSKITIYN